MAVITFAQAINEALTEAMSQDENVLCYGLGVPDPKGVFGTTLGLQERFGSERVFDMPTSENAMTGIGIGAAMYGLRPVITHQRMDFALLSMDQIVNNAAKWRFMFGGQRGVSLTVRMILGRGWGQGPTHSQNLQAWFAHIPGLKVVMPSTAADAKGLLLSSIFDPDPVIFLEHRWLHNVIGEVSIEDTRTPLGSAKVVKAGTDITIVSMSYMTVEALHAASYLENQGISCEVVDLRTIKPLDWQTIMDSVAKTGRLLALDSGFSTGSVAGEVIARVVMEKFNLLKIAPARLAMPDVPEPTSTALTKGFYVRAPDVAEQVITMMGRDISSVRLNFQEPTPHDVPGEWFKGPF
jgi:pyruvate dehydrogenase E1 component beta subunit